MIQYLVELRNYLVSQGYNPNELNRNTMVHEDIIVANAYLAKSHLKGKARYVLETISHRLVAPSLPRKTREMVIQILGILQAKKTKTKYTLNQEIPDIEEYLQIARKLISVEATRVEIPHSQSLSFFYNIGDRSRKVELESDVHLAMYLDLMENGNTSTKRIAKRTLRIIQEKIQDSSVVSYIWLLQQIRVNCLQEPVQFLQYINYKLANS